MADLSQLSIETIQALASQRIGRQLGFVDGAIVEPLSEATFDDVSPIDGTLLCRVANCGDEDVDRAVRSARQAFEDRRWSGLAPRERKKILLKFADLIERQSFELAVLECRDMGMPIAIAVNINLPAAVESIRWHAEAADKVYDEIAPTGDGALALIVREPLGVIAAIVPWNFPLMIAAWKLGPALAAGNSVILKPAEQSPLTALRLGALALEAGIPSGVLNVLPGLGEVTGKALALHGDVDALAFTGSTEVGKLLLHYSSRSNMKRVSLECGGKTPNIVLSDAPDLDVAARAAAFGIFNNQGQVCNAGSRLLVHRDIHDAFLEKVTSVARSLKVGNPLDPTSQLGTLVDGKQLTRVEHYVDIGQKEGAMLITGGKRVDIDKAGFYFEPTIFDQVSNDMTIAREEIFGPVLSTLTFADVGEAISIANDSPYGLGAALWTSDLNTAHKAAKGLRAGTVFVNAFGGVDMTVPFGGFKQSGNGRDRSLHALEKVTDIKTTWINLS